MLLRIQFMLLAPDPFRFLMTKFRAYARGTADEGDNEIRRRIEDHDKSIGIRTALGTNYLHR